MKALKHCIWLFEQEQALGFSSVSTNIRMTVIRLKSGGLWIHAPIAPTKECIQVLHCFNNLLQLSYFFFTFIKSDEVVQSFQFASLFEILTKISVAQKCMIWWFQFLSLNNQLSYSIFYSTSEINWVSNQHAVIVHDIL